MDPWRRPLTALKTLFSPIGTLRDKFCLGRMRAHLMTCSTAALYDRPDVSAMQVLKEAGFSPNLIDRFFRPFMGGVFFDPDLHVSRRMFEFVFQMFSRGDTALPAHGMEAIPKQLASRLPGECVRLNAVVSSLKEGGVILDSGEEIRAKAVVIATHGPETARLLGDTAHPGSRSITCLYFAAQEAPVKKPTLVLDGDGKGPVMNLCVPSVVAPSYAPPGRALVSVTVSSGTSVAEQELQAQVLGQMREWFGSEVDQWQHLKTYRIAHALPLQTSPVGNPYSNPVSIRTGLFTCGEYHNVASIQWALFSGRRAAEAVRAVLKA
jgi:phytoene dehydrogenase-like protein